MPLFVDSSPPAVIEVSPAGHGWRITSSDGLFMGILRDLFTEHAGGWIEEPALLDRLVTEKLAGPTDEAREREGWKWAAVVVDYLDLSGFGRLYPVAGERSEADAAAIAALSAEYDRLVSETDAAEMLPPDVDARLE